jgi:hypothetical protein
MSPKVTEYALRSWFRTGLGQRQVASSYVHDYEPLDFMNDCLKDFAPWFNSMV